MSMRMPRVAAMMRTPSLMTGPVLFEEGPLHQGYLIVHPMRLPKRDAEGLIESIQQILLK